MSYRYLLVGSDFEVHGIIRKSGKDWKILAELRSLDAAYNAAFLSFRREARHHEELSSINNQGLYFSASTLRSHLNMACMALESKLKGTTSRAVYPMLYDSNDTNRLDTWAWPLRLPEISRNVGNYVILFDNHCNFISIIRQTAGPHLPCTRIIQRPGLAKYTHLSTSQFEDKQTLNLIANFGNYGNSKEQMLPPPKRQRKIDPETKV